MRLGGKKGLFGLGLQGGGGAATRGMQNVWRFFKKGENEFQRGASSHWVQREVKTTGEKMA